MSNIPLTQAELPERGVLAVRGPDWRAFLQGLVSNDVARVTPDRAVYAALLTPQGKYLHDFFMVAAGDSEDDGVLLEGERARLGDLAKRLSVFKLRAQVEVADVSDDWRVVTLWGGGAATALGLADERGAAGRLGAGFAFVDPRLAAAGARALLPTGAEGAPDAFAVGTAADYDSHRLALGLPDGSRDMVVEKAILLENGFDELAGVDWNKGCYMGQELTARTKYRGLVKKRLMPVAVEGPLPEPGTPIMAGDKEAGEMRSGHGDRGLALVRLERIAGADALTAGEARLTPEPADWMALDADG